jgi:antirestriction protein ArdC
VVPAVVCEACRREHHATLAAFRERYQGINVIALWMSAELNGYASPFWLTFQQAKELGGNVKKGEHGSCVVFASTFKKKDKDETGDEVEAEIPFLKRYTVFNAEQCQGLPQHFTATIPNTTEPGQRIETAEAFFTATGADVRYGGNRAFYTIEEDYVRLPNFETFRDAESHAATLAHELCHWTRHPTRLAREAFTQRIDDRHYGCVAHAFPKCCPADWASDAPRTERQRERTTCVGGIGAHLATHLVDGEQGTDRR